MPPTRTAALDRTRQVQRVLLGLLLANLAVVGAKVVIGLRTGSLGVLGDAVHSSVDALNNVVALAVIWLAAREPDEDHPYGHEKFETLGALLIVVFLSITGFELVAGAVRRLMAGAAPIVAGPLELGILAGTLVVNAVVTTYETRRGRALNSEILLADATHTRADVLITIGVLAGVVASRAGYWYVDSLMAIAVAGVIVVLTYGIVARSVPVLVDQQVVPSREIRRIAEGVTGVLRAYHVRSRGAVGRRFAELTVAVQCELSVEDAHEIADGVERQLREELQFSEVTVHVEPC